MFVFITLFLLRNDGRGCYDHSYLTKGQTKAKRDNHCRRGTHLHRYALELGLRTSLSNNIVSVCVQSVCRVPCVEWWSKQTRPLIPCSLWVSKIFQILNEIQSKGRGGILQKAELEIRSCSVSEEQISHSYLLPAHHTPGLQKRELETLKR